MLPIKIELPENFLKEESRFDYVVSSEMKEIWAIELDLAVQILNICKKYNLTIMADGGTMLGAIRHKGFIPWDDDMDFMMLRKDYIKFCNIAPKELKCPYFLQTEYSDPGSLRGHAQLRNSLTTGMLPYERQEKRKINQGIFVDIFPYDQIPNNKLRRKCFERKAQLLKRRATLSKEGYKPAKKWWKKPFKFVAYKLIGTSNSHNAYIKFENYCQIYNGKKNCDYIAPISYMPFGSKCILKYSDCFSIIEMPFEFITIPVTNNYDEELKAEYGDWHKFVKGTSDHGEVFFDCHKSYIEYLQD